MKLYSKLRILSIICYLFIFIPGSMIAFPFILVLTAGLIYAAPTDRVFTILADLALIMLAILIFMKKNKWRILLECVIYIMLLSPFIWVSRNFPLKMFDFPGFIGPFAGFVVLYPLSIISSILEYKHRPDR
jgi:hypothetical protein